MTITKTLPTLEELPLPPHGKLGWPWTEQTNPLPKQRPDGSEWPLISIVTPSYNQGQFIEETIRSVLLQGYPDLEYIVIDGGSTDNSVAIIKKYEPWLAYWKSESDRGQSDAINQGFAVSTGVVMGWVNSDDILAKGALHELSRVYKPGLQWWSGLASAIAQDGTLLNYEFKKIPPVSENNLLHARLIIGQVATFWNRELWKQVGSELKLLHFAMDYELWLRFSKYSSSIFLNKIMGYYRSQKDAKTGTTEGVEAYYKECDLVRLEEYHRRKQCWLIRIVLINFYTRLLIARRYRWRSFFARCFIPYV